MESELFQSMVLNTGQSLEDYYSQILEKAQILRKPDHEIVAKFISGLPGKMAIFVRAGQPADVQAALTSAKMAEACGYRQHTDSVNAVKPAKQDTQVEAPPQSSEMKELKDQVKLLTDLVSKMNTNQQPQNGPTPQKSQTYRQSRFENVECRNCKGLGHFQRVCNWNCTGASQPTTKCQLCQQFGHAAPTCLTITAAAAQGNQWNPNDRHNRSGRRN